MSGEAARPNARISGHTKLVALIGWPVEHSLSPAMHNAVYTAAGLDHCYVALPVEPANLAAAVAGLSVLGGPGWNVTIPHKQAVIPLLDEITPAARAVGAVNTVVNTAGRLVGHNTDVAGFMAGLSDKDWQPGAAVVLGAGGAARAVVWGLASAGVRVLLLARRAEQAEELAQEMRQSTGGTVEAGTLDAATLAPALADATLLVNTTPLGMWPNVDETPLPDGVTLPAHLLVYDLIYHPRPTRLLQQAAASGCRTQDGIAMLVNQGAEAIRLWLGHEPDVALMTRVITD